jgi:hypothetical protein
MGFNLLFVALAAAHLGELKKHHHHHHHHHDKAAAEADTSHALVTAKAAAADKSQSAKDVNSTEAEIMSKMKELEAKMDTKEAEGSATTKTGHILVNGPLPTDFASKFAGAVAAATGCDPNAVKVIDTQAAVSFIQIQKSAAKAQEATTIQITFTAPADVVEAVEEQAADPDSKLVSGELHDFLVSPDDAPAAPAAPASAPSSGSSPVEIDTEMPYGELEPFGREDTAQELTDHSVQESDEMVDQLERAEVAYPAARRCDYVLRWDCPFADWQHRRVQPFAQVARDPPTPPFGGRGVGRLEMGLPGQRGLSGLRTCRRYFSCRFFFFCRVLATPGRFITSPKLCYSARLWSFAGYFRGFSGSF